MLMQCGPLIIYMIMGSGSSGSIVCYRVLWVASASGEDDGITSCDGNCASAAGCRVFTTGDDGLVAGYDAVSAFV